MSDSTRGMTGGWAGLEAYDADAAAAEAQDDWERRVMANAHCPYGVGMDAEGRIYQVDLRTGARTYGPSDAEVATLIGQAGATK